MKLGLTTLFGRSKAVRTIKKDGKKAIKTANMFFELVFLACELVVGLLYVMYVVSRSIYRFVHELICKGDAVKEKEDGYKKGDKVVGLDDYKKYKEAN